MAEKINISRHRRQEGCRDCKTSVNLLSKAFKSSQVFDSNDISA